MSHDALVGGLLITIVGIDMVGKVLQKVAVMLFGRVCQILKVSFFVATMTWKNERMTFRICFGFFVFFAGLIILDIKVLKIVS